MEKVWLKSYPPNVPAEIDTHLYQSIADMFQKSCKRYANLTAFSNLGTKISYAELNQQSDQFAAYLQSLGLQKGDRVAVMLPNVLQYPVVMFGILQAGLIVVNVNPLYTAPELEHQLKDSGAAAIIVLANFASVLQIALPQTQVKHVIVTEIGDLLGSFKAPVVNFVVKYIKKMVPAWNISHAINFKQAMQIGAQNKFTAAEINQDDIAFLQYTGGTTGVAKGAVLTHGNMIANVLQCKTWVSSEVEEGKETVIIALPLYHIFSLTICCLAFISFGGHGVMITNPRDIKNFIKELKKVPFSVFVGVNTLFNGLLHQPDFCKLDFSHLRLSISGGMATQRVVAETWQKVTNNFILEGYGLTEASPVVTINPVNIKEFTGSIGLPIPSTDIKACDEHGDEVALDEPGELWVKGPQVMRGYWQREDETKKVLTADGWLQTGDIVKINTKGFVFIVDRKKDMIIVSGFNVYPNEVEDVLAAYPGVLEVGVIGIPSDQTGEAVKAFVVKKDPNLTEQELLDYAHKYLTRYKIPKIIEFRNELPKSNVGKILRRKLRELS